MIDIKERQIREIEIDCDDTRLFGPIDDAIAYLQEIRAEHQGESLTVEQCFGDGYDYFAFILKREETDEEYQHRMDFLKSCADRAAKRKKR